MKTKMEKQTKVTKEVAQYKIETDDLYEKIEDELDHLGGMLSVFAILGASKYQDADNAMEQLLRDNENGFMTIMYDTEKRLERTRQMIRETQDRIPADAVTA